MKKTVLIIFLGVLLMGVAAIGYSSQMRYRSSRLKISSLPSIDLLLLDSTSMINTSRDNMSRPKILVYFSPDCEHCQRQIGDLVNHIATLRDTHIYLLTPMHFADLRTFASEHHLERYKNITLGWDYRYAFYKNFKATAFPCTAIYNSKKELVRLYRTESSADNIIESLQGQN